MKKIISLLLLTLITLTVKSQIDSTKIEIYLGANLAYNSGYGVAPSNTGFRYTLNSKFKYQTFFKHFDNNFYGFLLYDRLPSKLLNNYTIGNSIDGNKKMVIYPFIMTEFEQNLITTETTETGVKLRSTFGIGIGKKLSSKIRISYAILIDNYNLTFDTITNNPIYRNSFRAKYDDQIKNTSYGIECLFQPSINDINISRSKINVYVKYNLNKHFKLFINSDNFIDVYKNSPIERKLSFITFGLNYNY